MKLDMLVIGCLAPLLVFGFLWLTNPTETDHRVHLAASLRANHPAVSLFSTGPLADTRLTYKSYLLFSAGYARGERVTFGIAGRMFGPSRR